MNDRISRTLTPILSEAKCRVRHRLTVLLDDGIQHAGRPGAPRFRLGGTPAVGRVPLDMQVGLHPFEAQLVLAVVSLPRCYDQPWQGNLVGREYGCLGIGGDPLWAKQRSLVGLGACHKKSVDGMHGVYMLDVDPTPDSDVGGSVFIRQKVPRINIVQTSVSAFDKRRDCKAPIHRDVHHGAKPRFWKCSPLERSIPMVEVRGHRRLQPCS